MNNDDPILDGLRSVSLTINQMAKTISTALEILRQSGYQIIPIKEIKPVFDFNAKITELAALRVRLEILSQTRSAFIVQMKAQPDYQDNEYQLSEAERMVSEVTGEIKTAAVEEYKETGKKKLHDAVKVKVSPKFVILDLETATLFCKHNLPAFIVLDQEAFLDYANTISQDLSDYLVTEPEVIQPDQPDNTSIERQVKENISMEDIPF